MTEEIIHSIGKIPIKHIRANPTKQWTDRNWRIIINYFRTNNVQKFGPIKGLKEYVSKINTGIISFAPDKTKRKRKLTYRYL